MNPQTLTMVLFVINGLVGLVIVIGGFAIKSHLSENERRWDEQRKMNEKRDERISVLALNHEKNRKDIEALDQREQMIEKANYEKFADLKNEFADIKKALAELNLTITKYLTK